MSRNPEKQESIPLQAFMGFDGYIDTIARIEAAPSSSFRSMTELGTFLSAREERSGTLSLHRVSRRFGGNMPICAHALGNLGIPVDCVGALGAGSVHPVFHGMSANCRLHPILEPGDCTALEFSGGKLFLADHGDLERLDYQVLLQQIGLVRLTEMMAAAGLIGFFNWGELRNMQAVWEALLVNVFPSLFGRNRFLFFDLSDCSARTSGEILDMLRLLGRFRTHGRVVLSLNDNECMLLAEALACGEGQGSRATPEEGEAVSLQIEGEEPEGKIEAAIERIHAEGAADLLVHHGLATASVRSADGLFRVSGGRVENPRIITGGGDHFNAGFAYGLLQGFSPVACAELGNHVSRLFVQEGRSPDMFRIRMEASFPDARDGQQSESGAARE